MARVFAATFGCFLVATPALADLTAEEVLADHLNLLSGYGLLEMTTTGTTESPTGLTVEGFVGSYTDDDARIEVRTPGMILTEAADGSVSITYADTLPIIIHADPAHEDPVTVTLTLQSEGLTHSVSGEVGNITHDIAFDKMTIGEFTIDPPEAAEDLNFAGDITIAGFKSTIHLDDGEPVERRVELNIAEMTQAITAVVPTDIELDTPGTAYDTEGMGNLVFDFALRELSSVVNYMGGEIPRHGANISLGHLHFDQSSTLPEEEGKIDGSATVTDFFLNYEAMISIEDFENDLLQALLDGQYISGALNYGSMAYDFDIDTPEGAMTNALVSGASENRFSFSEHAVTFFSNSVDLSARMGLPPMPDFPISEFGYSLKRGFADFLIPLTPAEEPQPFHLRFAYEGLSVDDDLWNLFDPQARIPRTPANLSFDLDGSTVIFADPFAAEDEPPLRDTEATLNSLRLSIAGAEFSGTGKARDTSTPGNPAGVGELDMTLTGINTLLDTLVDMGLLPSEQAMGARMGLGLIARPGDGADTLVSKIEVNEEGQIFANGQRIK